MKKFQILDEMLLEEREEQLMQSIAEQEKRNGFLLFRPVVIDKMSNGDKLVDAVLGLIDVYEDETGYGYAKPGLFLMNANNQVFAKIKEDKDASIIKLYEEPFLLSEASKALQTSKLTRQAVYDRKNGRLSLETDGDIQKFGDTYVTYETQVMYVQKTRDEKGNVLETKVFEQHPSGRKEMLVKVDRDIASPIVKQPEQAQ